MMDVNALPPPPPDRRSPNSNIVSPLLQTDQKPPIDNKILQVLRKNIVDLRASLADFQLLKSEKVRDFIPDSVNIILFGPTGSGKSSLIK